MQQFVSLSTIIKRVGDIICTYDGMGAGAEVGYGAVYMYVGNARTGI